MSNRYFIVFFTCEKNRHGHIDIITDGEYLNLRETIDLIKDDSIKDPIMTNIIELNETDFKQWSPNP